MSKSRPGKRQLVSPSRLSIWDSVPDALTKELVQKSYKSDMAGVNAATIGTEVHHAMETGFNTIKHAQEQLRKHGQMPGKSAVQSILRNAFTRAQESLNTKSSQKHAGYVKSAIQTFGKQALENLNIDIYTEQEFRTSSLHPRMDFGGIIDVVLYDKAKKDVKILDWKNYTRNLTAASPEEEVRRRRWQTKGYIYGVTEWIGKENIDRVEMTYVYNGVAFGKPGTHHAITDTIIDATQLGRATDEMKNELSEALAKIETYRHTAAEHAKAGDMRSVMEYIKTLTVNPAMCNPGSCQTCSLRHTCTRSSLIIKEMEQGYRGSENLQSSFRKFDTELQHDNNMSALQKQYEQKSQKQVAEFAARREQELRSAGITNHTAQLQDEIYELRKSLRYGKYAKRGRFDEQVETGAFSADTKLPYNILDDETSAPWRSARLKKSIDAHLNTRIVTILNNLDSKIPSDILTRNVREQVFTDEKFIQHISSAIYRNAGATLRRHDLSPHDIDARKEVLRKYDSIFTKDVAMIMQGRIDKETVRQILNLQEQDITRKVGEDVVRGHDIDAITTSLIENKVMQNSPDALMSVIAKSETYAGKLAKHRLSLPRFPLPAVMGASILAYIAGAIGVQRTVENNMKKAQMLLAGDKNEIDAGQHTSTLTTGRRILATDFGSSYRPFAVSQVLANIKTAGSGFITTLKDVLTRGYAARRATSAGLPGSPDKLSTFREMVADVHQSDLFPLIAGAAGAGFIGLGLLPNMKSTREIGEDTERRKRDLKRLKQVNWNSISSQVEPESELRREYKQHTPFGHFVDTGAIAMLVSSFKAIRHMKPGAVIDYLQKTWNDIDDTFMNMMNVKGRGTVLREYLSPGVANAAATDMVARVKTTLSHTVHTASGMIHEAEQYVREQGAGNTRRDRIASRFRTMQSTLDTEKIRTAMRATDAALLAHSIKPAHGPGTSMPIVEKHRSKPHDTIVTGTSRDQREIVAPHSYYTPRDVTAPTMYAGASASRYPIDATPGATMPHEYTAPTLADGNLHTDYAISGRGRATHTVRHEPLARTHTSMVVSVPIPSGRSLPGATAVNRIAMNTAGWRQKGRTYGRRFGDSITPYNTIFM